MPKGKKKKFDTYGINIYKLNDLNSIEELQTTFSNTIKGIKTTCTNDIWELENLGITVLYLSYTNKVPKNEIEWFSKWKTFFEIGEDINLRKERLTGHGILVFYIEESEVFYAMTFGKSFSLIKNFIDAEYGMRMASILFDGKAMDTISSKYFSITANKTITSYNGEQAFNFEEGEAVDLLKSSITEHDGRHDNRYITELLSKIRREAIIGYAKIGLTARSENVVTIENLAEIIKLISMIENSYDRRFEFPKMKPVKDKQLINKLNDRLLSRLLDDAVDVAISVPFFNKDESDNLVFMESIEKVSFKYKRRLSDDYINFTVNDLIEFLKGDNENSPVEDIKQVKITIETEGYQDTDSVLNWLDTQECLDNDDNYYALNNGTWISFNQDYIERINKVIEQMGMKKIFWLLMMDLILPLRNLMSIT